MSHSSIQEILIVGAGEFGLATALALLKRQTYQKCHITVLDSSCILPNPSGSSVDTSRIIRADYGSKPYATLASEAEVFWRDQSITGWGGQGRYTESGFVLTADKGSGTYVEHALENVRSIATQDQSKIKDLPTREAIKHASKYEGVSGDRGYGNWNSGWAHAEKVVEYVLRRLRDEGSDRVTIRSGAKVQKLLFEASRCRGVELDDEAIFADLVILAAGAWTPTLIDLEGRCLATGQALTYIDITPEEQVTFNERPTVINLSRGTFIIPPQDCQLKIARHSFGYINPVEIAGKMVSVPHVGIAVPKDGQDDCRDALRELLPSLGDRPFVRTRMCWYCDTPEGDFLIDYHPDYDNLFIATGGSGHGFKFFPIIGEKIVNRLEGSLESEYQDLWSWKEPIDGFIGCNDGSRSGIPGLILKET